MDRVWKGFLTPCSWSTSHIPHIFHQYPSPNFPGSSQTPDSSIYLLLSRFLHCILVKSWIPGIPFQTLTGGWRETKSPQSLALDLEMATAFHFLKWSLSLLSLFQLSAIHFDFDQYYNVQKLTLLTPFHNKRLADVIIKRGTSKHIP